jgi:hypothetical protein
MYVHKDQITHSISNFSVLEFSTKSFNPTHSSSYGPSLSLVYKSTLCLSYKNINNIFYLLGSYIDKSQERTN